MLGSVDTVKSEAVVQAPTANATDLLSGRVAGLITKQSAAKPRNDETTINIRGFGTALILADGVQTKMTRIDPNAIESIEI